VKRWTNPSPPSANENRVGGGVVGTPLWLVEPADPAQELAGGKIDHAQAIVAQFRDEQPVPGEVGGQVVDAAANLPERDLPLKHQGLNDFGRRGPLQTWT